MNSSLPPADRGDLEALSRQLRALAQHLVHDSAAADDLVQEAWLAALNRPPEQIAGLGAWLRVVLRNLAARRSRRELLRQDAEQSRADHDATRETEDLLERSNLALALREAAHDLAEPVRSVIELHYFHGLTMEATAERLQRPLETVRSQRRRGIQELRGILDRRHRGARHDWLAALAPLLGLRKVPSMRWRSVTIAVWSSVALVMLLSVLWWFTRTDASQELAQAPALEVAEDLEVSSASAVVAPASERTDVEPANTAATPDATAEPATAPPVATKRFVARVVDSDGAPVDGASLDVLGVDGVQLGPFATQADGSATFEIAVDRLSYRGTFGKSGGIVVYAFAPGRAQSPGALVPALDGEQSFELPLGGLGQTLSGVVYDPDGAPLAEAFIELDNDVKHMSAAPGGVLLADALRQTFTDAEGRFVLAHLPRRAHRWVARARNLGVANGSVEGDSERLEVAITLPRGAEVAGVVRGSNGVPVANADVWVARGVGFNRFAPQARTDEKGRYRLLGLTESPVRIFVRAPAGLDESADALHAFSNDTQRSELDFELRARAPLEFLCLESDGRPAAFAMLTLETESGAPAPWRQSVATDEHGRARLADYVRAPLVVQLTPRGAPGPVLRREFDARVATSYGLRVGQNERSTSSKVHLALVDAWHSPLRARLVAVSSVDGSTLKADVDPITGVLDGLKLPAGERAFFAVDAFGVASLGSTQLDGVTAFDLGLHTFGPVRKIELEWAREGGAELMWLVVAELTVNCQKEALLHLPHGRTALELREGSYLLMGRTPTGDERVAMPFTIGDGHPLRLRVQ